MLSIGVFLFAVCAYAVAARRRVERVLPMGMGALMLLLTALAVFQKLSWMRAVEWVALAAGAGLGLTLLLTRRLTLRELACRIGRYVLTPCFFCFVILCAAFAWVTQPMTVCWRDDLVHWALSVKSLWHFGGLVDAGRNLNPFFGTYLPGMSLWQWWWMNALGQWHEGTLYAALFVSYVIFLLPLFSAMRWRHAWFLPVALLVLLVFPNWGNAVSYTSLSVDTALALAFGYTLMCVYELQRGGASCGTGYADVALGMCSMVLIKQIGLLFAAMALALLAVLSASRQRRGVKLWLCAASPFAVQVGWSAFCRAAGLSGFHTSSLWVHISAMLSGTYVPPEGWDGVAPALWQAITRPFTDEILFDTYPPVMLPKLLTMLALTALPLLLSRAGVRQGKKTAAFAAVALTGYLLVQFASFFTVFYPETLNYTHQASDSMGLLMERYLSPLIMALAMLEIRMALDVLPILRRRFGTPVLAAAAAGLLGLMCLTNNWYVMRNLLIPSHYLELEQAYGAEERVRSDHDFWAEAVDGDGSARVLVGLEPDSDFIKNLNYAYAPAHFEAPSASFLADSRQLAEWLVNNSITHVVLFDDGHMLHAPASELEESGYLYPWSLYEVCQDPDGSLRLVECY